MGEARRLLIFIWTYPNWGGSQMYFLSIIKEARKFDDVLVFVSEDSEDRVFDTLNELKIEYEMLGRQWKYDPTAGFGAKIAAHFGKLRSEHILVKKVLSRARGRRTIVQTDMGFWQSLLPLLRMARNTNVLMTIHTALPKMDNWRGKWWRLRGRLMAAQDRFYVQASNAEARDSLYQYLPSSFTDEIPVAYSGFDGDEIAQIAGHETEEIRRRFAVGKNEILICTVGQFIERKGRSIVRDAINILSNNGLRFKFVWLGTSPASDADRKTAASFILDDRFQLVGGDEIGSRKELLSVVKAADIFVLASLQEGLPIALLEAMALGRPCIATRVNAIPEAIGSGQYGVLVDAGDPKVLAAAIMHLAEDPEKRNELGQNAKRAAFEKFEQRESAQTVLGLYNKIFAE